MNKANFISRFELVFWDFMIQLLSSSKTAQIILRSVFRILHDSEVPTLGILLGISGVVGLVSGYLFYFLTAGVR